MSPHPPSKPRPHPRSHRIQATEGRQNICRDERDLDGLDPGTMPAIEFKRPPLFDRSLWRDHIQKGKLIKKHSFLSKDILDGIVFVTMYSKMKAPNQSISSLASLPFLPPPKNFSKPSNLPNLSNGVFHAIHIDGGIIFMLPNWDLEISSHGDRAQGWQPWIIFQPNYRYILCIYIHIVVYPYLVGRWQVCT